MSTEQSTARWYSVDRTGTATLCVDEADAIATATDSQTLYPRNGPYRAVQMAPVMTATAVPEAMSDEQIDSLAAGPLPKTRMCKSFRDFARAVEAHVNAQWRARAAVHAEGGTLEGNIRTLLNFTPSEFVVRHCEGGAEDIRQSLALTWGRLKHEIETLRGSVGVIADRAHSAAVPSVPEGWSIVRKDDGRIVVKSPNGDAWAWADENSTGTSDDFVYSLLNAMLTASPQAPADAGVMRVPLQVLKDASEALGHFVSDHGWGDADMQAMDNLDAYIARHTASMSAQAGKEQA
jgi:hypothetical protein